MLDRAFVDHRHAGRGDPLADPAGEGRGALAVEVAFQPMADRFVQQHAAPARAEHHRHLAGRGGHAFEVDQRLGQRLVDRPVPGRRLEQLVVEIAAAEPEAAGFAPVALLGDDRHVEPDQRPDVGGDEAVGADDLDHRPAARQGHADLRDPGVASACGGVDRLAQLDLPGEGNCRQRIIGAVHRAVGSRRRGGRRALGRIEQLQRLRGPLDRRGADLIGMGEGGRLAGHAAQAEARAGVEVGRLQPAVVEAERLGDPILEIELAIVMARRGASAASAAASAGSSAAIEKVAGIHGHALRLVGGSAFEHEAAVAIAAFDEAGLVIDAHR